MASLPLNADTNKMDSSSDKKTTTSPSFADLLIKLTKNCFLLVARFYVMCILIAFEWISKIVAGALKPLEPVAAQIKKVPKKDVSLEGIFYQFLRLQFILLLFVTPFIRNALSYVTQPLLRLRELAVDFVDSSEGTRKVSAQD